MNEFIEKLIGRLEEKAHQTWLISERNGYERAIEIVNQLAEEYNNDFCEWFKYDYRTIAPKSHDAGNPYWRIPENMDKLKHCPYCGKKNKGGGVMKEFVEKLIKTFKCEELRTELIAVSDVINIVNKLAEEYSVTDGWIPCSERLPEGAYGCLVTVMDCNPVTGQEFENILPYFVGYDSHTWNNADGEEIPFEVIAWQPLPEPYQPKGE